MADAAWRTITTIKVEAQISSYLKLQMANGRSGVDEILDAVRKKQSNPILVTGKTGSGKTCTLMSVAMSCRLAWTETRRRTVIPVYIDIARFAMEVPRVPLRDHILSQIGHDTQFMNQLNEAWSDKRANATWLFLLDNVDRALIRWAPGQGTYPWVSELADFINTNPSRIRAVLTGRDLSSVSGTRVDLSPLTARDRSDLLNARGATPAQQSALIHEKSFRQYVDNPGWLDLISDYLARMPGSTPGTFRELMADVLAQKIALIASDDSDISEGLIEKVAEESSRIIFESPDHNDIARGDLVKQISNKGFAEHSQIITIISELVNCGLMICYLRGEDEYVRFADESVHTFFLIGGALANNSTQLIEKLLIDYAGITAVISLLQFGSNELIQEILDIALQYLKPPEPTPQASEIVINRMLSAMQIPVRSEIVEEEALSSWTRGTYHLLYILEAGLVRRRSAIPHALREAADLLLAQASQTASPRMLAQMLDVQSLAHNDVAAACCAAGLRSNNGQILMTAARQVMSRKDLFSLLAIKDQMRLMMSVALTGVDTWASQHVDPEYGQRLQLSSNVGLWVGPLFFVVFGLSNIAHIILQPTKSSNAFLGIVLIIAVVAGVAITRRRQEAILESLAICIQIAFIMAGLSALIGVGAVLTVIFGIATGNLSDVLAVLVAYSLLWPICSLYYLAIEPLPTVRRLAFPFGVIIVPLWSLIRKHPLTIPALPTKRQLVKLLRAAIITACLALLVQISTKGWHVGSLNHAQVRHLHNILIWTAWSIIAISVLAVPAIDSLHDWHWLKEWKRSPLECCGGDVFAWLSSLHTSWGTNRLITTMTKMDLTQNTVQVLPSIDQLVGVLEWVKDLGPPTKSPMPTTVLATMPKYFSQHVSRWVKNYDRQHPKRLYDIATSHSASIIDYAVAFNQIASRSSTYMPTANIE